MAINQTQFNRLFKELMKIDLFGEAPPNIPYEFPPTATGVLGAIESGKASLPDIYRNAYVAPLINNVASVLETNDLGLIETLAGVVYEHAKQRGVTPQIHRFLATVSDLYRSFLSAKRRINANFPLAEQLPPLATFKHSGQEGPFTIPVDDISRLIGSDVGVVSLPATYRDHPFLWTSLMHETGGHDVLHADPELLPELDAGVRAFFGGGPIGPGGTLNQQQFLGFLWSYWIDEAASDIFGVLNVGPAFGYNLAVFFGALNAQVKKPKGQKPTLRTVSGSDMQGNLDPHPTDLLRIHLIIGAVESLKGLSQQRRDAYTTDLLKLAQLCAPGAKKIELQGNILGGPGVRIPVNATGQNALPLSVMQNSARRVGSFIATATLTSLGKHSIQDLETWDDSDEETALRISEAIKNGHSITNLGDDAQLLAGATLALYNNASLYPTATQLLNDALDFSYSQDPIFGQTQTDHAYLPTNFVNMDMGGGWHYSMVKSTEEEADEDGAAAPSRRRRAASRKKATRV
ncbi:MAG: hypothetical protein JOZ52_05720 [Acidobacteria bacterium]|nr:hypothetical protein [Acidobacteriota bacterium]